jgi:hypothetical protein
MRRETGAGKSDRNKMEVLVAHRQWRKKRHCGNCRSRARMSGRAAIHGAFCVTVGSRHGIGRRRSIVVVMVMHGPITVWHRRCMTGDGLACSVACRRQNGRQHGRKQSQNSRDGQETPHETKQTIPLFSQQTQSHSKQQTIKLVNVVCRYQPASRG